MDEDGDDKDDTKRRTRNLSEKKRRDQFNMLVTELSTLITSNDRKMDKSTVLKSTISYLKDHNEVTVRSRAHDVQEDWKPAFLSNEEFIYLVLEALEGFVMVFSASGRIYYVSESITSVLGHNPEDIVNKSIFDLTCEEDRANLYTLLQRNATDQIPNASQEIVMIRFHIRLRRGTLDFREEVSYDLIQFYGHFRTNQEQADVDRDIADQQNLESRVIFVSIGHLHTPQLIRGISLVDTSRCEFISRHSLEWKFLFLDHRAPPIIGYLPFEVLGTSGYDYYHFDDLEKVVTCHEDLMQKGELTSCYYRFLTKGQQWIWLQSRFYITYHQWNSKPEFVVCTHRVVSCEDVTRITKEEDVEQDTDLSDGEGTQINLVKDTPIDELQAPMSPSYVSEAASDAFGSSYQPISQNATLNNLMSNVAIPALSPSYTSVAATDGFGNSFQLVAQNALRIPTCEEPALSPSYMSECSDSFASSYAPMTQNILKTLPSEGRRALSPYMSEFNDSSNSYRLITPDTLKFPPSEEHRPGLSPSYMSERSDSYANTYPPISRNTLKNSPAEERPGVSPSFTLERSESFATSYPPIPITQNTLKILPAEEPPGVSPSYASERSESFANSYPPITQNSTKDPPSEEELPHLLPFYLSEAASDACGNSCNLSSWPASVKSASVGSVTGTIATAASRGASQKRARRRFVAGSDTASCSGESRSSQRNSEQGSHKTAETVAPQHGIGAQYLDPSPYVAGVPVSPGVLQLSTLPVLVTPEQVQIQWPWQEQLQRKHEELQQMILQQQEELRQVKEQLLLARLGILQPLISVPNPYSTPEEIQNQQRLTAQLAYSNAQLPITGYPPQVPLLPLTTLLPHPLHPPHPPHPSDPHQHMTQ